MKRLFLFIFLLLFLPQFVGATEPWVQKRGYHFTTEWFDSEKITTWSKLLKPYQKKKYVTYLEIGVWEGRSLLWMMDHILTDPTSRTVAVDMFSPQIEQTFRQNLAKSGHAHRVQLIRERSETALRRMTPNSFDIIYIDGAHDVKTVLIDAINAWELLKPGGILIFDDYTMFKDRFPARLRPEAAIDTFLLGFADDLVLLEKKNLVIVSKATKLKPWCHSCTWFDTYRYEWYDRQLSNQHTLIKLTEPQASEFEALLRRLENSRHTPDYKSIEKTVIQKAKSYFSMAIKSN